MTLYAIGSYTSPQGHVPDARGQGLSLIEINGACAIQEVATEPSLQNPTYVCWHRETRSLFTACEAGDQPGRVDLFQVTNEGQLKHQSDCLADQKDACHVSFDAASSSLFTASYGAGQLSRFSYCEGQLIFNSTFTYAGSGPVAARQEAPHAHQAVVSGYGRFLYVCDLGSDTIWKHPLPENEQQPNSWQCDVGLTLPAGAGPRHLVFHPNMPLVYILCELEPMVIVAEVNAGDGTLNIIQQLPSVSASESNGNIAPAAIKIHPSLKTLVVSNRFRDSIAVFNIATADGSLAFSAEHPCGGKTPRDVEFNEDGTLLLIANQDSHNVSSLSFNAHTGQCIGRGEVDFSCGSPVCLVRLS